VSCIESLSTDLIVYIYKTRYTLRIAHHAYVLADTMTYQSFMAAEKGWPVAAILNQNSLENVLQLSRVLHYIVRSPILCDTASLSGKALLVQKN